MRARTTSTVDPRAGLALARVTGLTVAEARALLAVERVLPLESTEVQLGELEAALAPFGVTVTRVEVPPTTLRCPTHPRLTADGACERCGRELCVLCAPRCEPCALKARRSAAWKSRRVGLLLVVLAMVMMVGVAQGRRRARRVEWTRPVSVTVVLQGDEALDPEVEVQWREALVELEGWFDAEATRHQLPLARPVRYALVGPVRVAPRPRQPEATGSWLADAWAAWSFGRALDGLAAPGGDVRLVVAVGAETRGLVEGVAEGGGDLGLVYASRADPNLTLELLAVAHETLHCLGAVDAYAPSGRAKVPEGLAEPELEPTFPQRFAEVMAGEVPDDEDTGHVPRSLDEVRLGVVTAKAIGW